MCCFLNLLLITEIIIQRSQFIVPTFAVLKNLNSIPVGLSCEAVP
jgi:hypothetical protein